MPKTAILLPLFGRPDFTIRILDFYNRFTANIHFIFLMDQKLKNLTKKF